MSEVAKLIKKRRIELGMTLEDVAKKVGVGRSTVRKWEEGMIKSIKSDKLEALADVLKISPVELVPGAKKKMSFRKAMINVTHEAGAFAEPYNLKQLKADVRAGYGVQRVKVIKVEADPTLNAMLNVWKVSDPKAKEAAVKMLETMADIKK